MTMFERICRQENPRSRRGLTAVTAVALLSSLTAVLAPSAYGDNQNGQKQDDAFTIKPETLAFGKQPLFTSRTESFWVRNKDKSPVRISKIELQGANEGVFAVQHDCQTSLAVGAECRINVKFEPTSDGEKSAELRIVSGDKSLRTRRVTGTGVQADYSVSPNSLAFGKVKRNGTTKAQTVTIRNTGNVALPITATSLSGPNEHQFAQSNDCPAELAMGKSCTSTILFKPTAEGHKTAMLTVWAKGGAKEKTVSISGNGT